MPEDIDTDRWYWDRRTQEALYPVQVDDDTVRFVTVWHREEATDAMTTGALVPLDDVRLDRTDTTFDLVDSFRTPDDVAEMTEEGGATSDEVAAPEDAD